MLHLLAADRSRRGQEDHPLDARRRPRLPRGDRARRADALAPPPPLMKDLRDWIALLEREGELVRVAAEVDPDLEITEIVDRTVKAGGPALLFENPKGAQHPLLINQFGTERRMCLAFGVELARRRRAEGQRRARDAAAAGADGQGARPAEAEVDRRLAADDRRTRRGAGGRAAGRRRRPRRCCRSSAAGRAIRRRSSRSPP